MKKEFLFILLLLNVAVLGGVYYYYGKYLNSDVEDTSKEKTYYERTSEDTKDFAELPKNDKEPSSFAGCYTTSKNDPAQIKVSKRGFEWVMQMKESVGAEHVWDEPEALEVMNESEIPTYFSINPENIDAVIARPDRLLVLAHVKPDPLLDSEYLSYIYGGADVIYKVGCDGTKDLAELENTQRGSEKEDIEGVYIDDNNVFHIGNIAKPALEPASTTIKNEYSPSQIKTFVERGVISLVCKDYYSSKLIVVDPSLIYQYNGDTGVWHYWDNLTMYNMNQTQQQVMWGNYTSKDDNCELYDINYGSLDLQLHVDAINDGSQ